MIREFPFTLSYEGVVLVVVVVIVVLVVVVVVVVLVVVVMIVVGEWMREGIHYLVLWWNS